MIDKENRARFFEKCFFHVKMAMSDANAAQYIIFQYCIERGMIPVLKNRDRKNRTAQKCVLTLVYTWQKRSNNSYSGDPMKEVLVDREKSRLIAVWLCVK